MRLSARHTALLALIFFGSAMPIPAKAEDVFEVKQTATDDLKAVFATVRSTDEINARVRTGGTITSLSIKRGSEVKPGDVIATVADEKLALRMKSLGRPNHRPALARGNCESRGSAPGATCAAGLRYRREA